MSKNVKILVEELNTTIDKLKLKRCPTHQVI